MPYLDSSIPALPFSDQETSREAAVKAKLFAKTQRDRVEWWYRTCGASGMTDKMMCELAGLSRQSLCARRNELMKLGRVVKTNRRRRNGCAVYVHVLYVEEGK